MRYDRVKGRNSKWEMANSGPDTALMPLCALLAFVVLGTPLTIPSVVPKKSPYISK